jgi:single-strand DNA-binding protein
MTVFGLADIGKIIKIEPFSGQCRARGAGFQTRIERGQYPMVAPQTIVDVPHEIVGVAVDFVVVSVAARITAKFLVFPAHNAVRAFQTGFKHNGMAYKSAKYKKYFRLQMLTTEFKRLTTGCLACAVPILRHRGFCPGDYQPFKSLHAMNALRNKVQLIGHLGNDPEITNLESGKKRAKLTLATNDTYRNDKGEKITDTQWHNVVAWGKTAEIIEKYVNKGKEIAVEGKLNHRSYEDKNGDKKYFTEVVVNELLLL